ncbi:MAG: DUF3396 domain-containing protein [Azoarcus sp.]|jgi:hypothetical protein|nr:DUF3396 domain-containing protein [Azoarcus sp.]
MTPWHGEFYVQSAGDNELSYYAATVPISNGKGKLHFDIWRDCVLAWAKRLRPAHGLAGLTVVMRNDTTDGPNIHLKKYPGLDVQAPLQFSSFVAENVHNRIKSNNWLTILGDEIAEELGGPSVLKNALEPDCTVHVYPGGVMIQAGEATALGDTDEGRIPELYKKGCLHHKTGALHELHKKRHLPGRRIFEER